MKLIGIKRALILAILLAINLSIAGIFFFGIEPMRQKANNDLAIVETQIGSLRGKIDNVKKELADFQKNLPKYGELKKVGFFNQQDRFQLGRDLDLVQEKSGLPGFGYSVSEVKKVDNEDAEKSKSQLIKSEILIDKPLALDDSDFYRFIYAMMSDFPSHLRLQSFDISRKPVDNNALSKIKTQEIRSMVDAKVVFEWMTIVPEEVPAGQNQSGWGR